MCIAQGWLVHTSAHDPYCLHWPEHLLPKDIDNDKAANFILLVICHRGYRPGTSSYSVCKAIEQPGSRV